jgi:hypothetical protein
MDEPIEYGIFRIGQVWRVVGGGRNEIGFPSLDRAVAAADLLVAAHRACGEVARIVVQDPFGRLVTVPGTRRGEVQEVG